MQILGKVMMVLGPCAVLCSMVVLFLLCGGPKMVQRAITKYRYAHPTFELLHGKNNERDSLSHGYAGFAAKDLDETLDGEFMLSRIAIIGPYARFPKDVTICCGTVRVSEKMLKKMGKYIAKDAGTISSEQEFYTLCDEQEDGVWALGIWTEEFYDGYYICVKFFELVDDCPEDPVDMDAHYAKSKSEMLEPGSGKVFSFAYKEGEWVCTPGA